MSSKRRDPNRIHEIQKGSVICDISRGTTNDGYHYLYYVPIREFFVGTPPKVRHTERFSPLEERDKKKAIEEACKWIKSNPQAADPSWSAEPKQLAA